MSSYYTAVVFAVIFIILLMWIRRYVTPETAYRWLGIGLCCLGLVFCLVQGFWLRFG